MRQLFKAFKDFFTKDKECFDYRMLKLTGRRMLLSMILGITAMHCMMYERAHPDLTVKQIFWFIKTPCNVASLMFVSIIPYIVVLMILGFLGLTLNLEHRIKLSDKTFDKFRNSFIFQDNLLTIILFTFRLQADYYDIWQSALPIVIGVGCVLQMLIGVFNFSVICSKEVKQSISKDCEKTVL